jgi:hypothetical protein
MTLRACGVTGNKHTNPGEIAEERTQSGAPVPSPRNVTVRWILGGGDFFDLDTWFCFEMAQSASSEDGAVGAGLRGLAKLKA